MAAGLVLLGAPGPVAAPAPPGSAGDPATGSELFRTRGCVTCHAGDVRRFQEQPRPLYALAAAMWNHFPAMADRMRTSKVSRPYFTSSEMRDLVAFLHSGDPAAAAGSDARLLGAPGDATRGRRLVSDKGCLGCHSITGAPGKHAGRLDDLKGFETPWSIVAQMWNHSFIMQLETRTQGVAWQPLSAGEMADLVAFLQRLMRAR